MPSPTMIDSIAVRRRAKRGISALTRECRRGPILRGHFPVDGTTLPVRKVRGGLHGRRQCRQISEHHGARFPTKLNMPIRTALTGIPRPTPLIAYGIFYIHRVARNLG